MAAIPLIRAFEDVPEVDPDHLRTALVMLCEWAKDGTDDSDDTIDTGAMNGEDQDALLDRIQRTCEVSLETTVALFKRAVALSGYCLETELPATLFDRDRPGPELFMAAAKAPVLGLLDEAEGEVSHAFNEMEMHKLLLAARN